VFSAIYGTSLREANGMDIDGALETSKDQIELSRRKETKMLAFLEAPSHIVAPPSRLITSFMRDILRPREEAAPAEVVEPTEQIATTETKIVETDADREPPQTDAIESWLCEFVKKMTWSDSTDETKKDAPTPVSAKKQSKKTEKLPRKTSSTRKTASRAENGTRS
jgi:hypothetical protein